MCHNFTDNVTAILDNVTESYVTEYYAIDYYLLLNCTKRKLYKLCHNFIDDVSSILTMCNMFLLIKYFFKMLHKIVIEINVQDIFLYMYNVLKQT